MIRIDWHLQIAAMPVPGFNNLWRDHLDAMAECLRLQEAANAAEEAGGGNIAAKSGAGPAACSTSSAGNAQDDAW